MVNPSKVFKHALNFFFHPLSSKIIGNFNQGFIVKSLNLEKLVQFWICETYLHDHMVHFANRVHVFVALVSLSFRIKIQTGIADHIQSTSFYAGIEIH